MIVKKIQSEIGRKGYNPCNMVATIIYCFSKFKSTIREIENLCQFDIRVMYLMEPSKVEKNFLN